MVRPPPALSPTMAMQDASNPLETRIDGNSILINTLNQSGRISVNFMHRPGIRAYSGDHQLAVSPDQFGRIIVDLPSNRPSIRIGYRIDWSTGLSLAILMIIAAILLQHSKLLSIKTDTSISHALNLETMS